jgi:carbon-monoxide dehydrogenase medium subunit
MTYWDNYLLPKTVDEALSYLKLAAGEARVVSGGTDLFLDLRQGRHPPIGILVDVTGIVDLRNLRLKQSGLYLGSAITHREIIENSLLNKHAQCLVEACSLIGGPQVRNVATIGGNVANALPAADGTIALLALDAEAEIASAEGLRWEQVEDLFLGPGKPTFDPSREILVRFRLPVSDENEKSTFHRIMRPQGVAIAILNMALWVKLNEKNAIEDIRIAVGPAGPKPFRARETEAHLRRNLLTEGLYHEAVEILKSEAKVRTSPHRATKEYREHLLSVLLHQVLDNVNLITWE